uniref:DekiORF52 n=1 Tax=Dendrolimus kikuchii nucleopolyhedrovirus TaxID=1219875 RepID=V9LSX7_9ABAC|nr:DekiORF52 [Dendrolimus kikuchii nucleopolyhedrovirus]
MASETCYCCKTVHKALTKCKPFDFFSHVELRYLCDACYEGEWCFCCHKFCAGGDYIKIDYDASTVGDSNCIVHMCKSCVVANCLDDDRICDNAWCCRELADYIEFNKNQCVLRARYGYDRVDYMCRQCK